MKEIDDYIINYETLVIMPYGKGKSKVVECDEEVIVKMLPFDIIKKSCLFFGSSFEGRKEGTKTLLDCEIKVPIIIEDSKNLIFFPSNSYKSNKCVWISYKNLLNYNKSSVNSTLVSFKKNVNIEVGVKYNLIDNQIIRCIKLDAILTKRKMIKN